MRGLGPVLLLLPLVLLSCGPARPAYTDRVTDLPTEVLDPRLQELTKLTAGKNFEQVTSLIVSWKRWLQTSEVPLPLQDGTKVTFVYYDSTDTLDSVWLVASFCPTSSLPLERLGTTRFFYRAFAIPKLSAIQYHFSSAATNGPLLSDPFHPDVVTGAVPESSFPDWAESRVLMIDPALEPDLQGQALRVLLPPDYDRDLSHTWPVIVLTGQPGTQWDQPITAAIATGTIVPVIVVSLVPDPRRPLNAQSLLSRWSGQLQPWLASRFRLSPGPARVFLLGWGDTAAAAQEIAAAHPDVFGKAWTPPPGTNMAVESVWNQNVAQVLRSNFLKVAP